MTTDDRSRWKRAVGFVLVCVVLSSTASGQTPACVNPGPSLSVTGGRFGDAFSLALSGPPGAAALLATDVTGGPVMTPFGSVCLGLTPSLLTMPVPLDAAGSFAASGILPLAPIFPAGSTLFTQAALAHPSLPGGFALTNGFGVTFRPPQLGILCAAVLYATSTGNFFTVDGASDAVTLSTTPAVGYNPFPVRVPRLGWFGWRSTSLGVFTCVDDLTGATVLTIPNAWTGAGTIIGPNDATAVSPDGAFLFISSGNPVPTVRTWSLPSGTLLSATSLPSGGYLGGIYPVPGTSLAYVRGTERFHVIDGAAGTVVATVVLPGTLAYPDVLSGTWLYSATPAGLVAVDITTHAIVAGPVPTGLPVTQLLAAGPGLLGPALWAAAGNSTTGYSLVECSLATLAVQNAIGWPQQVIGAKLSAGGSEWLLEVLNALPASYGLHAFNPSLLQYSPVLTSIAPGTTTPLRSNTLTKAYARLPNGGIVSFPTDPIGTPGPLLPLPPTASLNLRLLSN